MEVASADQFATNLLWLSYPGQVEAATLIKRSILESGLQLVECLVLGIRPHHVHWWTPMKRWHDEGDSHQAAGILIGQRPQQRGVHHAVYGSIGTDPDGKSEH